jgi:hypothetical protein
LSEAINTTGTEAPAGASLEEVQDDGLQANYATDEDNSVGEGDEPEPTQEELDEWEDEGKKYKIPKALKPHLMRQADYTRKTQEVAEQRRAIEADRRAVDEYKKLQDASGNDIAAIKNVDERLAQYNKLDWAKLEADDAQNMTNNAVKRLRELNQLRDYRSSLFSRWQQNQRQIAQNSQRDFAKRVEEGRQVLVSEIPGWSDELASKLLSFAKSKGIPQSTISRFEDDPHAVKLLHGAYVADQLLEKQKQQATRRPAPAAAAAVPAPQTSAPPAEAPKPVTQVTKARSGVGKPGLHDDLPPAEWVRRRNEELRRRA